LQSPSSLFNKYIQTAETNYDAIKTQCLIVKIISVVFLKKTESWKAKQQVKKQRKKHKTFA
jgi:hypothetical protein